MQRIAADFHTRCPMAVPPHIRPMLAAAGPLPPDDGSFALEYKWDGVRAICFWDGRALRLQSRNLLDVTAQYSEIAAIGRDFGPGPTVLDGEIVAFDESGRISFGRLQYRMHVTDLAARRRLVTTIPVYYMIFDLLYRDGRCLMDLPYHARRQALEGMRLSGPRWQTPPCHLGDGAAMLESARLNGLEGVVAKRLDSRYEPGLRSGAWLKTKFVRRQEFVIGGWLPGQGGLIGSMGSLLLGYHDAVGRLVFCGRVGTGFADQLRLELMAMLIARQTSASPFANKVPYRAAIYARPELVCDVEFTDWTADNILRHPSFKGLRFDKPPRAVIREE